MKIVLKSLHNLQSSARRLSYMVADSNASQLSERNAKKHQRKRLIEKKVDYYSEFCPTPLSLRQFLDFAQKHGDEKQSYLWLRQEVPTRLANMIKEMNRLPASLRKMPSAREVMGWYEKSFEEVISFENLQADENNLERFGSIMKDILKRHKDTVETMAYGVMEWKDEYNDTERYQEKLQYFLNRFYTSRIGIRILINQHILLFNDNEYLQNNQGHNELQGAIDPDCVVADVVENAYTDAKFLCEQYYLNSPDMHLNVHNACDNEEVSIIYARSHLYHVCFELFKNAMRATMELHQNDLEVPAIDVCITKGKTDCGIRISDRGGGASREVTSRWFEYLYSTAPRPPRSQDARITPLAGYGYGLPLSRLYARYLGGDLQLQSMEGYGTEAFIYLMSLSNAAVEAIPTYNSATREKYDRAILHDDWVIPKGGNGKKHKSNTQKKKH